jgi:NitT/TauT family transport system permease protein
MTDDTRRIAALERPVGMERFCSSCRLRTLAPLLSLTLGVILWELTGRWAGFRFLPPFSRVLRAAIELVAGGRIAAPLLTSFLSLMAGYGAAVLSGMMLGVWMGRNRTLEFALSPCMSVFLAAPKIALVPVLYAIFGLSRLIQVAVIFLSAFFVIALNTMRGIQTVDPSLVEMGCAFGASRRQLFLKVLLPGALPLTMAGLRLAIGHAVRAMVTAEMMVAFFGLGALLRTYGGRFDAERLFAVLLVVIGVALLCSYGMKAVERRMTRWDEATS